MTAELVALARDPRRRRLAVLVLALAASLVVLASRGGSRSQPAPQPAPPAPPPVVVPPAITPPAPLAIAEPDPPAERGRFLSPGSDAFFVQIADGRVYWSGNGGLWSAAIDGSDSPRNIVPGWVLTFQVEGDVVTYTSHYDVLRARIDGTGQPEVLFHEDRHPIEIASDGEQLYYSVQGKRPIRRGDWHGGRARALTRGGSSFTIAADATHLYVSEYRHGRVIKVPRQGGAPVVLARGMKRPVGMALDDTHVYFPCERDGTLRRVAKRGGRVTTLATDQFNHDILAVDDTHVYWGDWRTQSLMRVPKDGSGPAEVFEPDLHNIVGVAVDAHHVVVTSDGRVLVFDK